MIETPQILLDCMICNKIMGNSEFTEGQAQNLFIFELPFFYIQAIKTQSCIAVFYALNITLYAAPCK